MHSKTHQDLINAAYKAAEKLGIAPWVLLRAAGWGHFTDDRGKKYDGPIIDKLEGLDDAQKAAPGWCGQRVATLCLTARNDRLRRQSQCRIGSGKRQLPDCVRSFVHAQSSPDSLAQGKSIATHTLP